MPRPLVSLVLVTFNSEAVLPPLLDSLERTEYSPYELIVVDNGSRDGTLELVRERRPDAAVFENAPSRGYGSGCNQGARAARGDYLVFLNPDIVVRPDWLSVLVECFEDDARLGVASPEVLPPGWGPRAASEEAVEVSTVPGCSMMVSRAVWEELGGFDERIFLYWEDTDFCWRAWLRGWRVLESLGTHVVHDEGSGGGGARTLAGEEMKNAIYVTLKLRRARQIPLVLAGRALSTLVKAALWRRADVFAAWRWNAAHLHSTLALRREILRGADDERVAALERRIASQTRRRIRERVLVHVTSPRPAA